jgi:hypothetical protein
MLKISWAQLLVSSVSFFAKALGRSETQQLD